mmetsp:Transcript_19572/g.39409  ORF Transcript_19572/g.39409 Transcript_19572/m.39409 type:complete len:106 (+) Transcript_19572:1211-1528(+)
MDCTGTCAGVTDAAGTCAGVTDSEDIWAGVADKEDIWAGVAEGTGICAGVTAETGICAGVAMPIASKPKGTKLDELMDWWCKLPPPCTAWPVAGACLRGRGAGGG